MCVCIHVYPALPHKHTCTYTYTHRGTHVHTKMHAHTQSTQTYMDMQNWMKQDSGRALGMLNGPTQQWGKWHWGFHGNCCKLLRGLLSKHMSDLTGLFTVSIATDSLSSLLYCQTQHSLFNIWLFIYRWYECKQIYFLHLLKTAPKFVFYQMRKHYFFYSFLFFDEVISLKMHILRSFFF